MMNNLINAEDYIIKTFATCNVIGLGEGLHGLINSHQFFQRLFDNKEIQKLINVVLVEFANIDYQDILDDFIFGKEVSIKDLSKVWRESTQNHSILWDRTIYFELLKKIRDVNTTLAIKDKIRVIASDPSIDWSSIHTHDDYFNHESTFLRRTTLPAEIIVEHGIKKNKKVLLIYAGSHLSKLKDKDSETPYETITSLVNNQFPGSMKVIEILNPKEFQLETNDWPLYSILDLSNSSVGDLPAEKLFPMIFNQQNERIILYKNFKVKDIIDAFLYIGPTEFWKIAEIPASLITERKYMKELSRRHQILRGKPLIFNFK